jgi:hypothetical protein
MVCTLCAQVIVENVLVTPPGKIISSMKEHFEGEHGDDPFRFNLRMDSVVFEEESEVRKRF